MLYDKAPDYKVAIKAGKDLRYLWFALQDWRGGDSEFFFGTLGRWAEIQMQELSAGKGKRDVHKDLQSESNSDESRSDKSSSNKSTFYVVMD